MKIMGLGVDLAGNPLFPAQDEDLLANALVQAISRNAADLESLTAATSAAVSYRSEIKRTVLDPGDPRVAGWTFLVNEDDPKRELIENALRPLAEHRGMAEVEQPLLYHGESPGRFFEWLHDHYYAMELDGKQRPQYILLAGDAQQIPFSFQSMLNTVANVGRVHFDSADDLQAYVEKVIRLDTAPSPVVDREAIFFAPDAGLPDPTYFSREYMAEPIAKHVRDKFGLETHDYIGGDATKENLLLATQSQRPALVYTASHGLGATSESFEVQKQLNGAICCQSYGAPTSKTLFVADDVPTEPFLEGAVFFQFACFGYGTPAESDFTHWWDGVPETYTEADFVAALPKRLLAHPRGPIAYIGHLDTAWLHGFADVEDPHIIDRWHTRIAPFVKAIDDLLGVQPSGLAMLDMSTRYSVCNALITSTYDRLSRGSYQWTEERKRRFLDRWVTRGDAQNYMILGDPGVSLRIPA